ncbi:MAG: 16S rRNA processing protein RimM [Bacteroidota bacterium]|nr:16S rRNA processing protein RimM [Bacteroidota bacterium]
MKTELVAAAKILKVFGIRGEVKLHSYARTAEEWKSLSSVYIGVYEHAAVEHRIETVAERGGDVYVKFYDADGRTDAERLVGQLVFVEERYRIQSRPGRDFFVDDIIGMKAVDTAGNVLGVVASVEKIPAHDLYVVRTNKGEVSVPAVRAIVRKIDLADRTMVLDPPEGLFP